MLNFLIYSGIFLYMELLYHFGCFGLERMNPLFLLGMLFTVSSLQTIIGGCFSKKGAKRAFLIMMLPQWLVFAVQIVYYKIFRQPLRLAAVFIGGGDALTDFWRVALDGTLHSLPLLILLTLPLIAVLVLGKLDIWRPSQYSLKQKLMISLITCASLAFCLFYMLIGSIQGSENADKYLSYYDPLSVSREMGLLPMIQRDVWGEISGLFGKAKDMPPIFRDPVSAHNTQNTQDTSDTEATEPEDSQPTEITEPKRTHNGWDLDLNKLAENSSGNNEMKWLAEYIASEIPTNCNEYTGMFADYNLIYLTAEGFSPYAINKELTPTLYKMVNSSFVFNNYYVPLWQTSTSDGEYFNCTGLIPDGQFSMRTSASKDMAYTLPRFFAEEGVKSRAYHNNSLDYYVRHQTHPNLGYDFKASRLGNLPADPWESQLFPMEHPTQWPGSDLEMMQGTLPEYIGEDRFHTYYMTVSGHAVYTFIGNSMSSKNREAVSGLDMSENAKAYIACNIELDKALEYLIDQLEQAGKLKNTVICLSADHYPYIMTNAEYEELAGKDLSGGMDLYRNSLILWNAGMTENVTVDKACCSVDILPTLLNLFGFDFDSRMYAGRDIFSDTEGFVTFLDKSFVTDTVIYNRKTRQTTWLKDLTEEEKDNYLTWAKAEVERRWKFSAYVLRNDYYRVVRTAR